MGGTAGGCGAGGEKGGGGEGEKSERDLKLIVCAVPSCGLCFAFYDTILLFVGWILYVSCSLACIILHPELRWID